MCISCYNMNMTRLCVNCKKEITLTYGGFKNRCFDCAKEKKRQSDKIYRQKNKEKITKQKKEAYNRSI